ncbi:hypothetical protein F4814DRAFT_424531 [Daldinia grandis]|nr:hypothetical protein F4814DRAFT_424531 [Daldinia grandis]
MYGLYTIIIACIIALSRGEVEKIHFVVLCLCIGKGIGEIGRHSRQCYASFFLVFSFLFLLRLVTLTRYLPTYLGTLL